MKRALKSFPLVLWAAIVGVSSSRAEASSEVKEENTHAIVQKYEASRKEVAEAEAQKRKILGSLYGISVRMKKITHEKSHLTDELFTAKDNVKNIARVIAALEEQIQSERKQLKKRLRALYKISGEGYLAVVFSQTNPQDLDRTLRFLKIVTDNDYYLIRAYQNNIEKYRSQKLKLRGQVEKLITIEKDIKKQEHLLVAEHEAKSKIVSSLDKRKINRIQQMQSLRTAGQKLDLGDLLQPSIFEQKGLLSSPIRAEVTQDFGLATDEKYKTRLAHKGWQFASAPEQIVTSIYDGSVIFSDTVSGYGSTIVVDHGDHYYSVYSHIARPSVKTGDTIKRGQQIAETGNDGLYFEIRHFSEPENPSAWISRGSEKNSIATIETGDL